MHGALAAARVAVQLGRQHLALAMTVEEIARDAVAMANLGRKARRALERQRGGAANKYIEAARGIADRYDATLVALKDLDGCVLALKFRSGLYSSGFRNLFFVA